MGTVPDSYELLTTHESYLDLYSKSIKDYGYEGAVYFPSKLAETTRELMHKFGHSTKIIPLKNYLSFVWTLFWELKKDRVSLIHY